MNPDPQTFNYYNYFTEVEEYFQNKRGTWMLLSTLDWALIETWQEAGIPLDVVYRGIDVTFEKWEKRRTRTRRINGLGYCLQEVLAAFEEYKEAAVGKTPDAHSVQAETAFTPDEVKSFLKSCGEAIRLAAERCGPESTLARDLLKGESGLAAPSVELQHRNLQQDFNRVADSLERLTSEVLESGEARQIDYEGLERRLTAIEEKLLAAIKNFLSERQLADMEGEADRALAPYRQNMRSEMIANLKKQFIHKRLLEAWSLPRISLFHLQ